MSPQPAFIARFLRSTLFKLAATIALSSLASLSQATAIIPGPTGEFERNYLEFILDHHYSGLRPTELAAGTDTVGRTESPPPTRAIRPATRQRPPRQPIRSPLI